MTDETNLLSWTRSSRLKKTEGGGYNLEYLGKVGTESVPNAYVNKKMEEKKMGRKTY
jgi:hypothetical protein